LLEPVSHSMPNRKRTITLKQGHPLKIHELVMGFVNLDSRLRNCLTLRRRPNCSKTWLDLLQFLFNRRPFMRSRCSERIGKSPREVMTGQDHPYWLMLLGLGPLQPLRA
jgi:hypothetical protein